jgi:endonuclease-3
MSTLTKVEKVDFIATTLDRLYQAPPIPLDHRSTYELLIAVLLSAQTTDVKVNEVTPALFKRANTPQKMVRLTVDNILECVRTVGLAPGKSKNIHRLSELLLQNHDGEVPQTLDELEALPGVGHKTASVVVAQAFGQAAFPVDTHIHRLAYRWGLSNGKNVEQTEKDLKRAFPESTWNKLHLQIIYFGREYCPARSHDLASCPLCSVVGRKSLLK